MHRLLVVCILPVVAFGVIIAENGAEKEGFVTRVAPDELLVTSFGSASGADRASHRSMWGPPEAPSIAEQSSIPGDAAGAAAGAPSKGPRREASASPSDMPPQSGPEAGQQAAMEAALKQMLAGNAGMQARMQMAPMMGGGDGGGKGAAAGKGDAPGKGADDARMGGPPDGQIPEGAIPIGEMGIPMSMGPGGPIMMMMPRKVSAEEKEEMDKDKVEISAVTEAELEADEEETAKEKKEMAEARNGDATPNKKGDFEEAEEVKPKLAIIAEKEAATGHVSELSRKEDKMKQEKKAKKKEEEGKEGTEGEKGKDKSQMEKVLLDHKLQV